MTLHIPQLRKILIIVVLLFTSGVLVITSYSLWRLRAETQNNMLAISAMHSRNLESFITQQLRLIELTAVNVANTGYQKQNHFNIERSFITALQHNPAQRSISLLDEKNRIIVSSNRANVGIRINDDSFYPQPLSQSVLRIGQPWAGRDFVNGTPSSPQTPLDENQLNFLPVMYTLVLGKRTVTVLIAFNPDFFINHISQTISPEIGTVDIIRTDGTLLISTDLQEQAGSLHLSPNYSLFSETTSSGAFKKNNHNGRPVLSSFNVSDFYPFIVVTDINQEYATSNWQNKAKTLLSIIIIMLICLAILAFIFYRRQTQFGADRAESEKLQRINSTVFGSSADAIIITDTNANIISVNPAFCHITGYSPEEVIGCNPRILTSGKQDETFYKQMWNSIHKNGVWRGELVNRCKDGRLYDAHSTITAFRDNDGHLQHFIGVSTDITERKKSEVRLQQAASVFLNSQEGIMVTDAENRIIDVNPAFSRITGYSYSDVYGKNPNILSSGKQPDGFYDEMNKALTETDSWQGEVWNRKKSGEVFAERLSIDIVRSENGQIEQHVAVFSDISRIKIHEAELHRIAHYDPLTGIPNRRLLGDRLYQTIARTKRSGKSLAVCYLDLDGFKPVNDQCGHAIGDLLLVEITKRLLKILRGDDTLARLGGDEFVILFSELNQPEEIDRVLNRVLATINAPVLIEGHSLNISASIGVTLFPVDASDADTLLRHADQAMYRAKDAGKNRYHLFDPNFDIEVQARRSKLKHIDSALKNNEFVLYYQPKVNLVSGDIIGAEALIRWQHPEQGILPPAAFLDMIDGHDLEIELGEWVIESVLKQIVLWNREGLFFPVSANLSANHLLNPDFSYRLKLMLERYPAVRHEDLELEILETSTLNDLDQATDVLVQCRNMGIRFALDDFGTGYSSLTYFQRLPVDILKIDQSFVRDMLEDPNDLDIVESIVRLAQTFNRPVIAEGVETLEHGAMLIKLGCQQAQGYGIARPMPAENIPGWTKQWIETTPWLTINIPTDSDQNLSLRIATQSHTRWLNYLMAFLEDPSEKKHPEKINAYGQFGRWHHSSGFARYGALPEYQDIASLYDTLCLLSDELIELANGGGRKTACERLPELHTSQSQLLEQIQKLIDRLEIKM